MAVGCARTRINADGIALHSDLILKGFLHQSTFVPFAWKVNCQSLLLQPLLKRMLGKHTPGAKTIWLGSSRFAWVCIPRGFGDVGGFSPKFFDRPCPSFPTRNVMIPEFPVIPLDRRPLRQNPTGHLSVHDVVLSRPFAFGSLLGENRK